MKLTILIHLAKILNTFHCLKHKAWAHGNLTSHNVFVELPIDLKDIETHLRVQIDGIELTDLKKYANMFYSYRPVTVWSAPEVLKSPKKLLEPLVTMDIYSFGFLMWELYHE
jgi:Protein tyrosine and serine/threonine kinase